MSEKIPTLIQAHFQKKELKELLRKNENHLIRRSLLNQTEITQTVSNLAALRKMIMEVNEILESQLNRKTFLN